MKIFVPCVRSRRQGHFMQRKLAWQASAAPLTGLPQFLQKSMTTLPAPASSLLPMNPPPLFCSAMRCSGVASVVDVGEELYEPDRSTTDSALLEQDSPMSRPDPARSDDAGNQPASPACRLNLRAHSGRFPGHRIGHGTRDGGPSAGRLDFGPPDSFQRLGRNLGLDAL